MAIAGASAGSPSRACGRLGSTDILAEQGVEDDVPGMMELRDAGHFSPPDEDVPISQQLHAALTAGEDPVVGVLAQEGGRHRALVDVEDQSA